MRWIGMALVPLLVVLTACGESPPVKAPSTETVATAAPSLPAPTDALGIEVESVTSGHTRVVWAAHQNPEKPDTYVTGASHKLVAYDSRDGKGVRVVLDKLDNYARPILTPAADYILFTDKGITRDDENRKVFHPKIRMVPFGGGDNHSVAKGLAVDTWRDPATGIDWVYAVRDIIPTTRGAIEAKQLVRFPLLRPFASEVVWDRTTICPDSIQISRDGRQACGQFPWPTGGYIDFEKGDWEKLMHGCWTSMAPDNSGLAWVFDGAHRSVTMFATRGPMAGRKWWVNLHGAPDCEGHELYHPRWTNHPRVMTATGPYTGSEDGANPVTKGGNSAEILIGRFNEQLTDVEQWVQITNNGAGDFYPDVWIATGDAATLDLTKVPALVGGDSSVSQDGPKDGSGSAWPIANPDGAVPIFRWLDRSKKNEIASLSPGGNPRQCRLNPHGFARFDRHFGVDLNGGWAVPDDDSLGAIQGALVSGPGIGFEALITCGSERRLGQMLLQFRRWAVIEAAGGTLALVDVVDGRKLNLGLVQSGAPIHLAAQLPPETSPTGLPSVWVGGQRVATDWGRTEPQAGRAAGVVAVGGGADFSIEAFSVVSRAPGANWQDAAVLASAQSSLGRVASRKPLPSLRVRARLAATTAVPTFKDVAPYTGSLITYNYDQIEVLEGELEMPDGVDSISVFHWALLDKKAVPGFPRTVGKIYELSLESDADHPELTSENREDETGIFNAPTYFDISVPGTVSTPTAKP